MGADGQGAGLHRLTPREREVVWLATEGLGSREIGARLFISPVTVRHHLTSIFRKLQVNRRSELIVACYRGDFFAPAGKKSARPPLEELRK